MILGNNLLGQGQGLVGSKERFLGPPYYLLNDTFTTNRAAGAIDGTKAEPGPWTVRGVIDSNGKLSISGGQLVGIVGGAANFDYGCYYPSPVGRVPGRLLVAAVNVSANRVQLGWIAPATPVTAAVLASNRRGSVDLNGAILAAAPAATGSITVGAVAAATTYQIAVMMRAAGAMYLIKGGAFAAWCLLWIDAVGLNATAYPYIAQLGTTTAFVADYLRVPAACWLPTPLVSDGFSAWGSTDGRGHAEGIAGGLGSGGSGKAWTNQSGTFGASGNVAQASALSGGVALATVNSGKTDVHVEVSLTRAAGAAGAVLAYVDASNYVRLVHDGTNAMLIKRVAGVETTVITSAATYGAGAKIRASRNGTEYRLWYNGATAGTAGTIADAVFSGVTTQGIFTTDLGNTLDDLTIYAFGNGGEYAALDNY